MAEEEKQDKKAEEAPAALAAEKAEAKAEAAPAPEKAEAKAEAAPGKKERPTPDVLEKLTTTKLREICMEHYPQIKGVSGMKKDELVAVVTELEVELGLRQPVKKETKIETKEIKKKIQGLKTKKAEVLAAKDKKQLKAVRKRIKRLKRRIKKLKTSAA